MLNYLDHARNFSENYGPDEIMVRGHGETVLRGLADFAHNARVSEKYEWLKAYHNWFCLQNDLRICMVEPVGARCQHMFHNLKDVLPRATREEVAELRKTRSMYDLLGCPLE